MVEKVYLKIISYNKKGVETGKMLMAYGAIIALVLFLVVAPNDLIKNNSFRLCLIIFTFGLIAFGRLKMLYHQFTYEKIGQISIFNTDTFISSPFEELELINSDYTIFFSDSGYEGQIIGSVQGDIGRNNFINSGINTLTFRDYKNTYKYDIIIENSHQLNDLKLLLKQIKKAQKANS
jgi:hypothetical protein